MKLTEADFLRVSNLIAHKHNISYTCGYIRKVNNGQRNNGIIIMELDAYAKEKQEFEARFDPDKLEADSKRGKGPK